MNMVRQSWHWSIAVATVSAVLLGAGGSALAQQLRSLGIDVSDWQGNITAANWATLKRATNAEVGGVYGDGKDFVFMRSSRGGTTGVYNENDASNTSPGTNTLSQRYDDYYFVQNINRATSAGLFAGPYHFVRPDIIASTKNSGGIANTGPDEANHFIQMAGPWMRPGYLLPVCDLESGQGAQDLMAFCTNFSAQIYAAMGIRPMMYINGNYAANYVQTPIVSYFPTLWSARWPTTVNPQTNNPSDSYAPIYGPWDDSPYPPQPWQFWQYSDTNKIHAISGSIDVDVAQGGLEFVKDYLVPALWVTNGSGQWTTLSNWNSGQAPVAPPHYAGQPTPIGTQTLPTPSLPGSNDTVILDVPGASVTVTLASGAQTIRKLYMREALNLTGGSLSINSIPSWDSTPISAQFSGPVTLSGGASLSVHTLQVDATNTLTLGGGTLTFNTINLMPNTNNGAPASIAMSGDVNFNSVTNATAIITNGAGSGSLGRLDLGGGSHAFNVANGVGLFVYVPITNGALAKTGLGTLCLGAVNPYGGGTTISSGTLVLTNNGAINSSSAISISAGATFDLSAISSYTLSGNASLSASGTGTAVGSTAAGIKGASGGTVNLGTRPITLSYDGSHPALFISQGMLQLQGNAWTVNAGSALSAGTYVIAQQASGSITNSGSSTVSGTAIGSGKTASIQVSGNNVNLVIENSTTTTLATVATPQTYGTASFGATVSPSTAGGTVTFKDGSTTVGTGTLSGGTAVFTPMANQLTVAGSPHSITAVYGGDSLDAASTSSASTLLMTPKALTVTGLSVPASKLYDGTTATATPNGAPTLQGAEVAGPGTGGDGAPYTGDAVTVSGPAIGSYNSKDVASANLVTFNGLSTANANYTITPPTQAATITIATTAGAFISSPNPSLPGSNVTFIATVTNVVPGGPAPAGGILFKTNGVPLGAPVALNGTGIAAFITNSLPHASNTVAAEFAGDGNFLGVTNIVVQIVNTAPIAPNTTAAVARNQALVLSTANLLSLAKDPDGDALSITSAGPTSPNGGIVSLTGTNITYMPVTNFMGADLFSFVVNDPYGASSKGTVLVEVSATIPPPSGLVVPPTFSNGTFQVTFAGTSNTAYTAQWGPSVTGTWAFFQTITAGTDGLIQLTDTPVPPSASRYYRIVYP
jgi:autotransporter-associated beta strand protein